MPSCPRHPLPKPPQAEAEAAEEGDLDSEHMEKLGGLRS